MKKTKTNIRRWLIFFMIVLFLSGLTAIPVESELKFLTQQIPVGTAIGNWLDKTYRAFHLTNTDYPFLAYGYYWLAFTHFVLAILFIGPYRYPVKNKWVIEFGMIACVLIIPFAIVAGHFRSIPFWWSVVDCSFGVIGLIPLGICLKKIKQLETMTSK